LPGLYSASTAVLLIGLSLFAQRLQGVLQKVRDQVADASTLLEGELSEFLSHHEGGRKGHSLRFPRRMKPGLCNRALLQFIQWGAGLWSVHGFQALWGACLDLVSSLQNQQQALRLAAAAGLRSAGSRLPNGFAGLLQQLASALGQGSA